MKLRAKISTKMVTKSGISIRKEDISRCDIYVMKTVPVHRAREIQHDAGLYLKRNKGNFPGIALGNWQSLPNGSDIATPIYMISIIGRSFNRVVYIGKAESTTNRFAGGHIAALMLLHPKYQCFRKYISFAVLLITTSKGEVFPVEWVSPSSLRAEIVAHVEHSMVWKFQPRLNSNLKDTEPSGFTFETNFREISDEFIRIDPIRIRAKDNPIIKSRLYVSSV